jgi:ATP-binding cassette subfamily C protein
MKNLEGTIAFMSDSSSRLILRLLGFAKPALAKMMFSISMGVVGNLASAGIMIAGALLIAIYAGFSSPVSQTTLIFLIVVFALSRGVFRFLEQYSGHDIAFRILAIIRKEIFASLRKLAPAKMANKRSGEILSTITSDVEYIEVFFAHTIAPVAIGIITPAIINSFIGLFWPGYSMILIIFQLLVGFVLPFLSGQKVRECGRSHRNNIALANSHLLDSIQGLKEISLMNYGERRLEELDRRQDELAESAEKMAKLEGNTRALSDLLILTATVTIFLVALWRFNLGLMDPALIVVVTVAASSSFAPLIPLSALSSPLSQTLASAKRVFDLIDEEPEITESIGVCSLEKTIKAPVASVEYRNVAFRYQGSEGNALKDVSLRVEKGCRIVITGKSGSGKSTLLRLLMRFWDVKEGSIFLQGRDIKSLRLSKVHSELSLVEQQTFVFDDTLEENIKIGNSDASHEEVVRAAKKASIHEFIMSLPKKYDTRTGELGSKLSGGEQQRLALARAFIRKAPIVLLDEPTSNLDTLNEKIILKSISDERDERTFIMVSHRVSAQMIADRSFTLDEGSLIEYSEDVVSGN